MIKKKRRKIAKNADFGTFQRPNAEQCCETCRFIDTDFLDSDDAHESWCRRYPPSYVGPSYETLSKDYDVPNDARYWDHPTVGVRDWCGEWRQRE